MTATTAALPATTQRSATAPLSGMTTGAVRTWLRLEGLAAFVLGLVLFGAGGGNWLFLDPAAPAAGRLRCRLPRRPADRHVHLQPGAQLGARDRHVGASGRGSHRRRSCWLRPSSSPTSGWTEQLATVSNSRARSMTPTSAGWDKRKREPRPRSHVLRRHRGRRSRPSRGRRPRCGHDACRRRARRRSSSIAVQAVRRSGGTHRRDRRCGARRTWLTSSSP